MFFFLERFLPSSDCSLETGGPPGEVRYAEVAILSHREVTDLAHSGWSADFTLIASATLSLAEGTGIRCVSMP